jgi:hypothetical protein
MSPVTIKGNTFYDWDLLVAELQRLLAESDWTQLLDSPLAEPLRVSMAEWRSELRELLHTVNPSPSHMVIIPECPVMFYVTASAGGQPGLVMPEYEAD